MRAMDRDLCESNVCSQLKDSKIYKHLIQMMLGLNEAIDWLAMANSVHWHSRVLRTEDGHVLGKALDFED